MWLTGRPFLCFIETDGTPQCHHTSPRLARPPQDPAPRRASPGPAATWKWCRGSRKPSRKMISKPPVVITLTLRLEENEDELLTRCYIPTLRPDPLHAPCASHTSLFSKVLRSEICSRILNINPAEPACEFCEGGLGVKQSN